MQKFSLKGWLLRGAMLCTLLGLGLGAEADTDLKKSLSVMTWNVWFDRSTGSERYPSILADNDLNSSDVVFLQEVTPQFITIAHKSLKASELYFRPSSDARRSYGQAFLTNKPLLMTEEYSLDSQYGRDALFGAYHINHEHALILINVHLESGLFESNMREHQVEQITKDFEPKFRERLETLHPEIKQISVIWAGDFNMGYKEFPNGISGFKDSAKVFSDNTPTYHLDNNRLANYTAGWFEDSARLDRILIQSKTLTPKKYQVKNNKEYAEYSDHYPVIVELTTEKTRSLKESVSSASYNKQTK